MKNINLSIDDIKEHGFLCASILHVMRETNLKTAVDIAEVLHFTTARQIELSLVTMGNKQLLEYVRRVNGSNMAFIL